MKRHALKKLDWAPSKAMLRALRAVTAPWSLLTAPCFLGVENVPRDRPVMFVANHTLLGLVDAPLLITGTYQHTGHFPRAMGDHDHFKLPGWRDLLTALGVVPGTRENCRELLRQGHSVLVFPGGGREVMKCKGEQYKLLWKERSGFARLAREAGVPIVPVAAVGAEECYRILLDESDLMRSPFGPVVKRHSPRADRFFPTIVCGLFGTPVPRPQRFYFLFGEPIESEADQQGPGDEDDAIWRLREKVRRALERQLADLQRRRRADPERKLGARLAASLKRLATQEPQYVMAGAA